MSFSSRVKEELSRQLSSARHCQIAEIAAILSLCGRIHIDEEDHYSTPHPHGKCGGCEKILYIIEKSI